MVLARDTGRVVIGLQKLRVACCVAGQALGCSGDSLSRQVVGGVVRLGIEPMRGLCEDTK